MNKFLIGISVVNFLLLLWLLVAANELVALVKILS